MSSFLPTELAQSYSLPVIVSTSSVIRILVVIIVRIRDYQFFFYRQLVVAHQFKAVCINAFSIKAVSSSKRIIPSDITSPAPFVKISPGNCRNPILFPLPHPFVENGNAMLQGEISEPIIIFILWMQVIEIVKSEQDICFGKRLKL